VRHDARPRPGEEKGPVGVRHYGADVVDSDLVAEDNAQDERGQRKARLPHQVSHDPEDEEGPDILDDIAEGVGANDA
jgi:hypothetical protein